MKVVAHRFIFSLNSSFSQCYKPTVRTGLGLDPSAAFGSSWFQIISSFSLLFLAGSTFVSIFTAVVKLSPSCLHEQSKSSAWRGIRRATSTDDCDGSW